mgnify:FL=1
MENIKIGYCLTGSYCTFSKSLKAMEELTQKGIEIFPFMSEHAYQTDTRFGKASDFIEKIEGMCGKKIVHTIEDAEPIGPKKYIDALVISPCTGNTLSKISMGITDTAVTMAAKASLRNKIPVIIALATNDGLSGSAKSLGTVLNTKNVYFVPFGQDSPFSKPTSLVCDFCKVYDTLTHALSGEQLEPLLLG